MESDLFNRGKNNTRLANPHKYAGRRKSYGNTGRMQLLSTPNVLAMVLILTGILAASAGLLLDQPKTDESETYILGGYATTSTSSTTSSTITRSTSSTTLVCTSCPDGTACGRINSYGETCQCYIKCGDEKEEGCKNTCQLAGTLANAKKATTTTSTTTSSTTSTTVACGGDLQPPCKGVESNDGCNDDTVLGSDRICHSPVCLPSVPSGLKGCGAFALAFCQPGQPYKYVRTLDGREVRSDMDPTKDE